MDTGNFAVDPYPEIEKLAPHAAIVQAKTYYGGGEWYTLDLDYQRIANTLRKANFTGWVSLEMEGKEDPAHRSPEEPASVAEGVRLTEPSHDRGHCQQCVASSRSTCYGVIRLASFSTTP